MRFCLALIAIAAAGPAAAQCLDSSALRRGVAVEFDTGDRTISRLMADGFQQVDETYANGDPTIRYRSFMGVYFLSEVQIDPATGAAVPESRLEIEFPVNPAKLPLPVAGNSWTGQTVNAFEDGVRRDETTTVAFSAGAPLQVSGCTYETVRADLRYDWGDAGGLTLVYAYLPALEIGVLLSSQFDFDEYGENTPVSITALSK